MKKIKLFVFGFALLLFISCQKDRNKLISSWKVTNVESKKTLSDSMKNVILSKGNLTFAKDGKVTGFLDAELNGTYALNEGGKSLTIKDETGTPYPFSSTIDKEQLVLDGEHMILTLDKN
ncbi:MULTISPECIES: hypothetical protein [unclassified Flavobacterium]|uniref:hypothetical protein n=1 Tax=unclassified Flavobacterium TaxID=196869 RepID=UPI000F0C97C2|nr:MULTISPECIES: hypothetical protein [unclassified Flavobacterium]AYN03950.1 hypothetical protein EAG11_06910 [Flavobacterium sp. 140616W15]MCD0475865.1 hypothetical protein [Flavobacterium sp. EDS]